LVITFDTKVRKREKRNPRFVRKISGKWEKEVGNKAIWVEI